jgi:hypothetical protein
MTEPENALPVPASLPASDAHEASPSSERAPDGESANLTGIGTESLILETRRRAAAVLEVLGGEKTPAQAALALSISIARYYLLEARALEGLVASCEQRPRGWAGSKRRGLRALQKENDRLRAELSRTQALARAIQRTTGLPEHEDEDGNGDTGGRARRRRRPHARALRAAKALVPERPSTTSPSSAGVEPPHQP